MGIFSFFTNKPNVCLILSQKDEIELRLNAIKEILIVNCNSGQAQVIDNLIIHISEDNIAEFISEILSVNMWGGPGAVWEVWFKNDTTQKDFAKEMLGLIIILEKLKISNDRIKAAKGLFQSIDK